MSAIRTISTYHNNVVGRRIVAKTRTEISNLGIELSTGLKADVAKSLGMRSAQSIGLRNVMSQTAEYEVSGKLLENKMETIANSLASVRNSTQDFMELVISNTSRKSATASTLQMEAKAKMDAIAQALNVSFDGEYLFSGTTSSEQPLQSFSKVNPNTGWSPESAVQSVLGGGITSLADANAKIALVDEIFSSTHTADPSKNFEGTFYGGTPEVDGSGNPNGRVIARPDENTIIEYGIQANDEPFKDILKGMAMLAAIDTFDIADNDAYKQWVSTAAGSIQKGLDGIITSEAKLGGEQNKVSKILDRHADKMIILNNRVVSLEYVDPYEAQAQMASLETQLQATYSTTARLSRLTFLDYMR